MVCTKEVFQQLEGYRSRYLGKAELAGALTELYDLYEGDPYSLRKHKEACEGLFRQGVEAYYQKDYQKARALFMEILRASLEVGVSRNYMYCADRYCTSGCEQPVYQIFEG